nr:MAG: NrdH-redoxin [Pseudomonadota bacterium]
MLTWIDDQGEFHVVQKPSDVPPEARKTVRVVVAGNEAGTGQLIYVADLNETAPDGSYRLKTMSRAAWDELGASRRKARLEALAPPSPGAAPSPSGAAPTASARPGDGAIVAIVYGAEWCQPCHQAERYLRGKGIAVIKKDVEESQAAAAEMRQKLERAGMRGASIPVIDVMGRLLVGFSPRALDAAVNAARSGTPL